MAPQATLIVPTATPEPSTLQTPESTHKSATPVTLFVFLGLCLAYTFSYVLYRVVTSRRLESADDTPDSPDRGVSQFMNGARLTLNFGHNRAPVTPALSEPDTLAEEKRLTDPPHTPHPEIPKTAPAELSSPFIVLMPALTIHPSEEMQVQLNEPGSVPDVQMAMPTPPPPALTQPPFSQRVAAKVKFLSRDREEAIALDPKLAPVQGPLRRLSMEPTPLRKKRMTGFGFGKPSTMRGQGHGETRADSAAR